MVTISLAVPDDLKRRMDEFQEINWSAVARLAFSQKISDLELLNKIKAESELSEQDALMLGRDLTRKVARKYKARR